MTREPYLAERNRLPDRLKGLRTITAWATALTDAAALLRDLPAATPEQRNDLARLTFERIELKDDRVVAVVPQPDFAVFRGPPSP